jgi:hypothetical protein
VCVCVRERERERGNGIGFYVSDGDPTSQVDKKHAWEIEEKVGFRLESIFNTHSLSFCLSLLFPVALLLVQRHGAVGCYIRFPKNSAL